MPNLSTLPEVSAIFAAIKIIPDVSWIAYYDHGYGRPSVRPRVSAPATYHSGTPRDQLPAVARW
jgi:hypothetical protein